MPTSMLKFSSLIQVAVFAPKSVFGTIASNAFAITSFKKCLCINCNIGLGVGEIDSVTCQGRRNARDTQKLVILFKLIALSTRAANKSFSYPHQTTPTHRSVNFTNILHTAFTLADPKSAKKTVKLSSFLLSWDLCAHKSCS